MATKKPIIVFLGGGTISGAEKRIIKTFSLVSKTYKVSTTLVIEEDLYKKIAVDEKLSSFLHAFEKIHIIKKLFCLNPVVKMAYLTFLTSYFLVTMTEGFIPYFCLLSPLYAPPLLGMKRIYFEVTSPDIVRMRSLTYMVRLLGQRLILVAVSEGVESKLLVKLSTMKNPENTSVLSRRVPFSEPIASDIYEPKDKIVVFAHRLIKRKNPFLAVSCFLKLAVNHPDWSFNVYGDGPEAEEITILCASSKVPNVKYFGRIDNLPSVLKKSMIFVSLIEPDNYPSQSILEAMLYKNALILSDTGYTAEKLLNGNGYLVSLDITSITSALEKAINDSKKTLSMGEMSCSMVAQKYSTEAYLEDTLRILNFDGMTQ